MKFIYYRPEVNGLRGIAVMAAVFYHAEIVFQSFRILPGGFLGVDVFFVISGYLMNDKAVMTNFGLQIPIFIIGYINYFVG